KALKPGSNCSYIVPKTVCRHEPPQHPTIVGSLKLASSTLETKTLIKAQEKEKK
ncbi:hypothetical protein IscW_ISCW007948, partial [Ixodes scapularis]